MVASAGATASSSVELRVHVSAGLQSSKGGTFMRFSVIPALMICMLPAVNSHPARAAANEAFLGRWDITIPAEGKSRARYCWLEATIEGGTLKGRFNPGGGAVFPLPEITVENDELRFQHPVGRLEDKLAAVYRARLVGGKLEGTATFGKEPPRKLTGVRGPKWPTGTQKKKPGTPVDLFNGKDMSGWLGQNSGKATGWSVEDGLMVNEDRADNIYTEKKFRDFKLEVEFNVAPKSNSGIYLRGRYEIQIIDGEGRPRDIHSQGALYGFIVPAVDVDKKAGEWQKFEITLVANRVTVILNGTKIIDDGEVPGITGGALDASESDPGPIMLQGDHGPVKFRKVQLTPLE